MARRVVVVGTSFGARVHVPALRAAGFEVVALVGRDAAKTEATAKGLDIELACTSLAEAIERGRPDAVTIATPPDSHAELALEAIAAGLHVLCEKPLAYDDAEAEAMCRAAESAGVVNLVGFEFRFNGSDAAVRRAISDDRLGTPAFVSFSAFLPLLNGDTPVFTNEWWYDSGRGGGLLNASGSHYVDRLQNWIGDVSAVSSRLLTISPKSSSSGDGAVDDSYVVLFQMGSGATALLSQCFVSQGPPSVVIRIEGSGGSAWTEGADAIVASAAGKDTLPVPPGGAVAPPEPPAEMEIPAFTALATRFLASIEGTVSAQELEDYPTPTFASGLAVQRVMSAMRRSSELGGALCPVEG